MRETKPIRKALKRAANGIRRIRITTGGRVEGEGSTSATRSYLTNLGRALLNKSPIKRGAARARRAVEGPEGKVLRAAEARARRGPVVKRARAH